MSASKLSHEDRILWNMVARTATPLRGKAPVLIPAELDGKSLESVSAGPDHTPPAPPRPVERRDHGRLHPLDSPTRNKLAKGRLPLEARVDLHGLNQSEAHHLLLSFLHRAFAQGVRHVLVITGKGSSLGGDGILRKVVPAWFATPPFRPFVGGYDVAGRGHGGAGALYVRLRRRSEGRGA